MWAEGRSCFHSGDVKHPVLKYLSKHVFQRLRFLKYLDALKIYSIVVVIQFNICQIIIKLYLNGNLPSSHLIWGCTFLYWFITFTRRWKVPLFNKKRPWDYCISLHVQNIYFIDALWTWHCQVNRHIVCSQGRFNFSFVRRNYCETPIAAQ